MRAARLLILSCLAFAASAATIDCAFPHIRDTTLGGTLATTLQVPAVEGQPAHEPLRECSRVLITWSGPKAPPVVRFKGVAARELMGRYAAAGAAPVESRYGAAYPLPQQQGFVAVALADDELLIATPTLMAQLEAPEWPTASGNVMDFTGPATDLKLGDLQDELRHFNFVWGPDGKLVLRATATSKTDAKAVIRYISLRKPLVDAAAGVGIEKAEFPSKLLNAATFDRKDAEVIARMELDDPTRLQAVDYLAKAVTRQMRKYR